MEGGPFALGKPVGAGVIAALLTSRSRIAGQTTFFFATNFLNILLSFALRRSLPLRQHEVAQQITFSRRRWICSRFCVLYGAFRITRSLVSLAEQAPRLHVARAETKCLL